MDITREIASSIAISTFSLRLKNVVIFRPSKVGSETLAKLRSCDSAHLVTWQTRALAGSVDLGLGKLVRTR